LDNRHPGEYKKKYALREGQQPKLGQASQLKLMPFQVLLFSSVAFAILNDSRID